MIWSKRYIAIVFMLLLGLGVHGQESWKMVKEKEDIKIYTRVNTIMSFKEFKATMEVEGKIEDFLSVLYDVDGLVDWGYNLNESRLLDRPDDWHQTYYAVADAPWPYKDRDGVYSNIISWDEESSTLKVEIDLVESVEGTDSGFVRLDGTGFWIVKKIADNKLNIHFQMQIDPGGSIKAWMANMFVTDSPFYTMTGLRAAMKQEKYQGKTYEFLSR